MTTIDFFAAQESAKKRTGLLLFLFAAAVLAIVITVHLLVAVIVKRAHVWDPRWILLDAAGTIFVILCGAGISASSLTGSGKSVAEACGGRSINPASRDPDERKLLNVVEEMAIASGIPVPAVYVLDEERGINAFAAGSAPNNAAVAVTRGAMERFTRDELQGVIGHEFSHILNGDMRLNLRLASCLAGIMGLAVIGELVMRLLWNTNGGSSRNKKDGNGGLVVAIFLIGLGLFIIGYVGVFFGRLIQAAVSRQREFLADASAVQFTRNPDGLAGALKKIAGFSSGSALRNPQARMFRHSFFSRGDQASAFDFLFATHPPITERIQLLDPSFDPAQARPETAPPPPLPSETSEPADDVLDLTNVVVSPLAASHFTSQIGRPKAENLGYAKQFISSLPQSLIHAAHDPHGASAIVFALLLDEDENIRRQQLDLLQKKASPPVNYDLEALRPHVARLAPGDKLPLLELAIPGLRQLNPVEYTQFTALLQELVESDGFLDLFEFTLQKMLRRHLDGAFRRLAPPRVRYQQIESLQTECIVLLSCLAHQGNPDDSAGANLAFQAGLKVLDLPGAPRFPLPADLTRLDALGAALDKLAEASPGIKKRILSASVAATSADNVLRTEEAELLRAISDTLDCPVPPGAAAAEASQY